MRVGVRGKGCPPLSSYLVERETERKSEREFKIFQLFQLASLVVVFQCVPANSGNL